jgi:ribosome biogenesis GTPase A
LFCVSLSYVFWPQILPRSIELIQSSDRYHRTANPESNILVVGIPNVGKSSLINILRARNLQIKGAVSTEWSSVLADAFTESFFAGKATPVGDKPGVTRAVLTSIRVSNNPLVYLIDTPGVMMPSIDDMHVGLKLAMCCK